MYQQYLRVVDKDRVKGNTSYAKLLWTLGENDEAYNIWIELFNQNV